MGRGLAPNAFFSALGTAVRLQRQVGGWCQQQGIDPALTLKVGVHHGPAIVMTANGQRLVRLTVKGPRG